MSRRIVVGLCFILTAAVSTIVASAQQPPPSFPVIVVFHENAPFESFRSNYEVDERALADPEGWSYLDQDVVATVQTLEKAQGWRADHIYSEALQGFAARLTAEQIEALENDPLVAYVEPDGVMTAIAQILPWGIDFIDADLSSTQAGDGTGAVSNVNVYIIDTGVAGHLDLNRVGHVNFAGGVNNDCHGHGTHVAGTVAARDNTIDVVGVAPGAPITGVKVLNCFGSGSTSNVIRGVDWVTANARRPAIANMSLGGGISTALDSAVRRSADSGVFYSIAAGNSGANACNTSPARAGTHDGVMTTAAIDINANEPSWSNYGACVDIWAPGVSILSTRRLGGTTTMSGTSMAAPHVGGTGALYLSSDTVASPAVVEDTLKFYSWISGTNSRDGRAIQVVYAGFF